MNKLVETIGLVEVSSDGTTVCVDNADRQNIGRFSAAGTVFGETSTLKGKPGPMTRNDWILFQFDMLDVYGVRISDKHMPDFLRVPA